jgi:hypothetical protein
MDSVLVPPKMMMLLIWNLLTIGSNNEPLLELDMILWLPAGWSSMLACELYCNLFLLETHIT